MKTLYMEGHNVKLGLAVSLELVAAPPVRYYNLKPSKVRAIVERFNRMQARCAQRARQVHNVTPYEPSVHCSADNELGE